MQGMRAYFPKTPNVREISASLNLTRIMFTRTGKEPARCGEAVCTGMRTVAKTIRSFRRASIRNAVVLEIHNAFQDNTQLQVLSITYFDSVPSRSHNKTACASADAECCFLFNNFFSA